MKQEYNYENGRVTAYDDKIGICNSMEYQDNIENIFETENTIEKIQKDLPKLKKEKNNLEELIKAKKKSKYTPLIGTFLISSLAPTICFYVLSLITGITFSSMTVANIHFAKITTLIFCPLFTLLGGTLTFSEISDIKLYSKKTNGLNEEIKFLEKELINQKEKLNKIKLIAKREKEEEMKNNPKRKINNEKLINELKELRNIYYNLGYNEQKYVKYFNKNKLNKKMTKYYTNEGIKIIEENINEKVKLLKKEDKN